MTQSTALLARILATLMALSLWTPAVAQDSPFAGGWVLTPSASTLGFQSVKNDTVVEQSGFATLGGTISDTGAAQVRVVLDSIDTKIDLRNVRMRFLFFETFKFPEATISVRLDPALLADLATKRRITITLPYTLVLHGVTAERSAAVTVTLITDTMVNVASVGTIPVNAADFNLTDGVTKLQEAAGVKIVPTGSVTFDFIFERAAAAAAEPAPQPSTAALEPTGDFDAEACRGRFEILSNAGNINFRSASARLNVEGSAILDNLLDIVTRCPTLTLEIGGHTDDNGSDATNQTLSEKRAAAVIAYLVSKGIAANRLTARGYGEAFPLVSNDSAANMTRNRRIEFKALN